MPRTILGIQGFNPWNLLLFFVLCGWYINARQEGLKWDIPRHIIVLLSIYALIIFISFFRLLADYSTFIRLMTELEAYGRIDSTMGLISEHIINSLKWVIPGMLLFHGCNSRKRLVMALISVLGVYFLLAIQVIRWMPIGMALSGADMEARSIKILLHEVGYHRVNLSMMLAGASWAIFSTRIFFRKKYHILAILMCSVIALFGQALTAGRAGYVTWAGIGGVLCLIKWRKYLFLAPIAAIILISTIPGVWERLQQGFSPETYDTSSRIDQYAYQQGGIDLYTVTSGRVVAWPFVIEKIGERPWIGHGKLAMIRTGIATYLWLEYGETFPHPHNAYLQLLLDNGWLGFIPIMLFYILILKYSYSLFRDGRTDIYQAIGGVTMALILALFFASIGSQTFYPREGALGMWCSIGLMMRVYCTRRQLQEAGLSEHVKFDADIFDEKVILENKETNEGSNREN
jgi:O-antigen ligase